MAATRSLGNPRRASTLGALVLAASSVALTVMFLDRHRPELASLSRSGRDFAAALRSYGMLGLPGAWHSAAGATIAVLIVLAWYGMGALLRSFIGSVVDGPRTPPRPRSATTLEAASACALGAGAWSLV